MAGAAASEAVLFLGAIMAATAFVGVFSGVAGAFADTFEDQGKNRAHVLASDVTILNDPDNVPTSPFLVYVKNTGSTDLFSSDTHVVVDGEFSADMDFDVLDSTEDDQWPPGYVLEITVNDLSPGVGDHRMKVVSGAGIEDVMTFRVV